MSEAEWEDRLENEFPDLEEAYPETNEGADPGAEAIPEESYEEDTQIEDADGNPVEPEKKTDPEPASEKQEPEEPLESFTAKISGYDAEISAAQTERANLTGKKTELEQKLARLKKTQSEDEWFGEEEQDELKKTEQELSEVTGQLTAAEEKSETARRNKAAAFWDREEKSAREVHADFDEVVYEKFAPLLDAEKGDPGVIAAWNMVKDKSPKGCYAFAKKVLAFQEWVKGEEKKSAPAVPETKGEEKHVTGKAGLDLLNSATGPADTGTPGGDVIDRLFPAEN